MPTDYHLIDFLISLVLALIMFGLGLSLTIHNFKNIFIHPKVIITGLLVQIIIIPIIAFIVAEISGLSNEMKTGLVIISVCASGAASNLITYLFKGNVALAISMTSINSLLTLTTIPFVVNLALLYFFGKTETIRLPYFETIAGIFLVTIIPASLGLFIRMKNTEFALKTENYLKYILPVLLGAVFIIKIFAGQDSGGTGITLSQAGNIFPYALVLNIMAMLTGFFIARLMKFAFADQYTIGIEVGLHNTALALMIAGTILRNQDMQKPALVYAGFSFFTAILFAYTVRKTYCK